MLNHMAVVFILVYPALRINILTSLRKINHDHFFEKN